MKLPPASVAVPGPAGSRAEEPEHARAVAGGGAEGAAEGLGDAGADGDGDGLGEGELLADGD